jgi:hypothetical protein
MELVGPSILVALREVRDVLLDPLHVSSLIVWLVWRQWVDAGRRDGSVDDCVPPTALPLRAPLVGVAMGLA